MSVVTSRQDMLAANEKLIAFFAIVGCACLMSGGGFIWGAPGLLLGFGLTFLFIFLGLVAEKVGAKIIDGLADKR